MTPVSTRFRSCQGSILWIYAAVMIPLCFILVFTTPTASVKKLMENGFSLDYPTKILFPDYTVGKPVDSGILESALDDNTEISGSVDAVSPDLPSGQKETVSTSSNNSAEESQKSSESSITSSEQHENSEKEVEASRESYGVENSKESCGKDYFLMPTNFRSNCHVAQPKGYTVPFRNRTYRLWNVPRPNLGWLNTSEHDYNNQVKNQRWLHMGEDVVEIRENGGTSVRAFGDNWKYWNLLEEHVSMHERCKGRTKPVMLDTGAGVASVAAVAKDPQKGNNAVSILSYVPVDNYLRLGAIISDRGLPTFIHSYSRSNIPLPSSSLDVVHCRWCWHHLVGYDVWLNEMNRLLVPGGTFVFTFVPLKDEELLPHKPWFEALDKMPWNCTRQHRIVQVCKKESKSDEKPNCQLNNKVDSDGLIKNQTSKAFDIIDSKAESKTSADRLLNINCPSASACSSIVQTARRDVSLSTFQNKSKTANELKLLLNSGKLGILHDWKKPGPFYPRTFDVVNLLCEKEEEVSAGLLNEVHRLLRPGGFALATESTCNSYKNVTQLVGEDYFKVVHDNNNFIILQRSES